MEDEASAVEQAVDQALGAGYRTGDLRGNGETSGTTPVGCEGMGSAIIEHLEKICKSRKKTN
jgi:isocitrate/isopropylmalate dehydrogenase